MSEKKLIVTADDFGLTKGINNGTIEAHLRGIVTRASIIANGEAFEDAILLAKKNKGLPVGIHLTLVEEIPVLQHNNIRSLTGVDGKFLINYRAFFAKYILRKINIREVYVEWESQIQKVLATGVHINHIDSHQHLHLLPGLFDQAIALAIKYKIKKIRMHFHDLTGIRSLKELILALLASLYKKNLVNSGIRCSDYFWGLKYGGNIVENNILNLIDNLKDGTTELMCHPGYEDKDYHRKYHHWNYKPEEELKALISRAVREKLNRNKIKLVS